MGLTTSGVQRARNSSTRRELQHRIDGIRMNCWTQAGLVKICSHFPSGSSRLPAYARTLNLWLGSLNLLPPHMSTVDRQELIRNAVAFLADPKVYILESIFVSSVI